MFRGVTLGLRRQWGQGGLWQRLRAGGTDTRQPTRLGLTLATNRKAASTSTTGTATRPTVHLHVNRRVVEVPEGASLLQAVRAAGVEVPALCNHPRFPARAVCRLCLVEVSDTDNSGANTNAATDAKNTAAAAAAAAPTKTVPACATPARNGVWVETASASLKSFRRSDAELLLARHPNECLRCEASGNCKLQDLVRVYELEDRWPKVERSSTAHPEHALHDHTSPAIQRDMDKCIECGLCVDACGPLGQNINAIGFAERGGAQLPVTVFDLPLSETECISCGQCTWVCPVGALVEKPAWHDVAEVLSDRKRVTAVQVAPATRVAIGEAFGLAPGDVSTGRLVNALRSLGFDYVFDTNFAADLTIMEESAELLQRLEGRRGPLPLFTSCCPGWINYVELSRPDLLPHLSTAKSPQQMHGAMTKRGPFAHRLAAEQGEGHDAHLGGGDTQTKTSPYIVSIMPCTAKKDEALRPSGAGDIDAVLTTRELARLVKAKRVPFASLPNDGAFDSPLGESTGAAQIFGASGGVMEAAIRTAVHAAGLSNQPLDVRALRGVAPGVKVAHVEGIGEVAVANGIASAIKLLSTDDWRTRFKMIEVMACVGGCLGGGGEPKSDDPDILMKRAQGVYSIDQRKTVRRSHENAEIQRLYRDFLGAPLSDTAEDLLHTTYAPRHSPRDLVGRFVAAIDRRDGRAAAALFEPDGVLEVGHSQVLVGPDAIGSYVETELDPQPVPPPQRRHTFAEPASHDSLVVNAPNGRTYGFDAQLGPNGRIARLVSSPSPRNP
eukprot:m.103204 g.103204  ORF g.103204 m.103204 type:complete len:781 (+) comp15563_c1_seq1:123-2465(+)